MKPRDQLVKDYPRKKTISESSTNSGPFPLKSREVQTVLDNFKKSKEEKKAAVQLHADNCR